MIFGEVCGIGQLIQGKRMVDPGFNEIKGFVDPGPVFIFQFFISGRHKICSCDQEDPNLSMKQPL
jgi:hypothetical protein